MRISLKKIENKLKKEELVNLFKMQSSSHVKEYFYNNIEYEIGFFIFNSKKQSESKWVKILNDFTFDENFSSKIKDLNNVRSPSLAIIISNKKKFYLLSFGFVLKYDENLLDLNFFDEILRKIDFENYNYVGVKNNYNQEAKKLVTLNRAKSFPSKVGDEIIRLKIKVLNDKIKTFTNGNLDWTGSSFIFDISETIVKENFLDRVIDFISFLEDVVKIEKEKRESFNEKIEVKDKNLSEKLAEKFIEEFEKGEEVGFSEDGFYFEENFVVFSSDSSYFFNEIEFTNSEELNVLIKNYFLKCRYKNKMDFFKKRKIVKDSNSFPEKRSLLKIINFYFYYDKKNYLLENGKFYELTKSYIEKVDERLRQLESEKVIFYKDDFNFYEKYTEDEIIQKLAVKYNLKIFHKKFLEPEKIEICDLAIKIKDKYEAVQIKKKKTNANYNEAIENINQSLASFEYQHHVNYKERLLKDIGSEKFEKFSLLFYFPQEYFNNNLYKEKKLDLTKIKSIKFKLELIKWHTHILERNSFNVGKIYVSTFSDN